MSLMKWLRRSSVLVAVCCALMAVFCGCLGSEAFAVDKLNANDLLFFGNSGIYHYFPCASGSSRGGMENCTEVTGDKITWIGDSYSTGARSVIESKLPGISFGGSVDDENSTIQACKNVKTDTDCNAKGRNNPSALKVLERVISAGELKPILVLAVGTNEGWDEGSVSTFKGLMEKAKAGTKVVLVTARTPNLTREESNKLLKELADSNPDYYLADWVPAYDASYFSDGIHPAINGGYNKWVEVIYNALPRCTGGAGDGDFSKILTAKNADKYYFNGSGDIDPPAWSDTDPASMKALLENYGDLAYQTGLAAGVPWIGILVQTRYEESSARCGKNNFWGLDCPVGTPVGDGMNASNLGEGFKKYAELLVNGPSWNPSHYHPVLGISDPKEFLRTIGPLWVQGEAGEAGYALINDMERSVDALTNFVNSPEGQAIVKTFGNYYYNGGVNSGNSSGGSSMNTSGTVSLSASGDAVNYAGDVVFTAEELKRVAENQDVYEEVANEYNMPWQVLAVLHSRENSFTLENHEQGLYGFYWRYKHGERFPSTGTADRDEFLRQTKLAAEDFLANVDDKYDINSEEGIKRAFYLYNSGPGGSTSYEEQALRLGFSDEEAKIGEGSPYVMNRYDKERDPTVEPTKSNGTWIQIICDPEPEGHDCIVKNGGTRTKVANNDFGAYVKYVALTGGRWASTGGLSSDCEKGTTAGNGGERIAEVARLLAWPDKNHYNEIKPEYADAAREVGIPSYATVLGLAQDCGHFVAVVVRKAVDPDFPEGGTPNLESYMHKSSLWEEIENLGNESNLLPGDVFVANTGSGGFGSDKYPNAGWGGGGHTYIYLGGSDHTASASLHRRTGNLGVEVRFQETYGKYRIFRSTVNTGSMGGTVGAFDEGLKAVESKHGVKVGAAVTEPGNKDASKVQVGGSWSGGRAWSTIKVPLAIAATQKNASTGQVNDPYGNTCSHALSSAITAAITQSDNCAAWWLWVALGGDNSSAASTVTAVISSGGDSSTSVNGSGDGTSLTSGKTNWSLVGQAIFAANMSSVSNSPNTMGQMKKHNASDGTRGINKFTAMSKGGWGDDPGTAATRQFGIIKLDSGKCSAIAIGTDAGSNFAILDEIATVIKQHQSDIPSGACPAGL